MSQILWILPTFVGKIPDPDKPNQRLDTENLIFDNLDNLDPAEDRLEIQKWKHEVTFCAVFRITTLTDNLSTAPIEKNWNRLMGLQGVFANIGINFLNVSDH